MKVRRQALLRQGEGRTHRPVSWSSGVKGAGVSMGRILFLLSLCCVLAPLWIVSAIRNQPTVAPDDHTVRAQITAVAASTKAR